MTTTIMGITIFLLVVVSLISVFTIREMGMTMRLMSMRMDIMSKRIDLINKKA